MSSLDISEVIGMYSSGVISRAGLENAINRWDGSEKTTRGSRNGAGGGGDYVTLAPDDFGVWRPIV